MAVTVVVRTGEPGGDEDTRLVLDAPRIVIGRSDGCEVRLPDASVSARHATLKQRGGSWLLADEGSSNGTYLGGARLAAHTPRVIAHGDLVRIGRVWLELRLEPTATTSPPHATKELALALVRKALEGLGEEAAPRLTVKEGADAGKILVLDRANFPYVLGRGEGVHLELDDADASRRHAQVLRRGTELLLRDLGAKNGTFVADARISKDRDTILKPGASFRTGTDIFVYENAAADALAELDKGDDQPILEGDVPPAPISVGAPPLQETPEPPQSQPLGPAAPIARVPTEDDSAPVRIDQNDKKSGWGPGDMVIVLVALVVLGVSAFGLFWLFRG